MKTCNAKTSRFVLTLLLAMSLSSGVHGEDKYSEPDEFPELEDVLPGLDPLVGLAAEIDNEQDLREARTSFEDGLLELERVIINEGLRRALDEETLVEIEGSSQIQVEDAVQDLRACEASCDIMKEECLIGAPDEGNRFNTLSATSCEIDRGQCEVGCILNLVEAVASMPGKVQGKANGDPALQEQREEAVGAVLIQDLREAQSAIDEGVIGLQRVPLEEGIRISLEDYEEYGVPAGETRIVTATNDLRECSFETVEQTAECIQEAANRSVDGVVVVNGKEIDQVGIVSLLAFKLNAAVCVAVAATRQLGCGKDVVTRYLAEE